MTNLGLCVALIEETVHVRIVDLRAGGLVVAREFYPSPEGACPVPRHLLLELAPHEGSDGSA
eukprot:6291314-Pyramimonas_sp.AAC.1